jgi:hypothetical protein
VISLSKIDSMGEIKMGNIAPTPTPEAHPKTGISEKEIQSLLNALRGLRFGSVEIIVQDSRIIQIERVDVRRLV